MTFPGGAAQPQRLPNGYVQMGGGYEQAVQGGNPQQQQQVPMPPQMTQLGQPAQQDLLPPQMQDQNYTQIPQMPQRQASMNQYAGQMRQIPQQGQFQSPQQQAGMQQPVAVHQQPQLQNGIDLEQRVYGNHIPPELQGRTVREIIAMNTGLRQIHLNGLANQPQQVVQQPNVTQQQPNQQGTQQVWDWRNPEASIGKVVDTRIQQLESKLEQILAPMAQDNAVGRIQSTRDMIAREFGPVFSQIEPLVLQKLQGADPRTLTNPEAWRIAADSVIGQASRRGLLQPSQQQQQTGGYPQQQVGMQQNPVPNLNSFYSEVPNQGGPGTQGVALTQQERFAASAMQMSEADYAAWKGGVPNGAPQQPFFGGAR